MIRLSIAVFSMVLPLDTFKRWLLVERGYSPLTVESYLSDIRELCLYCRENDNADPLQTKTLRGFIASLHGKNSAASVARKLSALRTFFRYLVREQVIDENPLQGIANPKLVRYIPSFLTVDEVFCLLDAPDDRDSFAYRDHLEAVPATVASQGRPESTIVGILGALLLVSLRIVGQEVPFWEYWERFLGYSFRIS